VLGYLLLGSYGSLLAYWRERPWASHAATSKEGTTQAQGGLA
jgi:hypothetical protein